MGSPPADAGCSTTTAGSRSGARSGTSALSVDNSSPRSGDVSGEAGRRGRRGQVVPLTVTYGECNFGSRASRSALPAADRDLRRIDGGDAAAKGPPRRRLSWRAISQPSLTLAQPPRWTL